jgi:hypothetical protein
MAKHELFAALPAEIKERFALAEEHAREIQWEIEAQLRRLCWHFQQAKPAPKVLVGVAPEFRAAAVALLEAVEALAECIDGLAGNPCDDCQAATAAAAKKLREAMK